MSRREGLGIAAIEAMASGLPIITSNVHGINDYSVDNVTGYKCRPDEIDKIVDCIMCLDDNSEKCVIFGKNNVHIAENFDISIVSNTMKRVYQSVTV